MNYTYYGTVEKVVVKQFGGGWNVVGIRTKAVYDTFRGVKSAKNSAKLHNDSVDKVNVRSRNRDLCAIF